MLKRIACLIVLANLFVFPVNAQDIEWISQFGTSASDNGRDICADGNGNTYICGQTRNLVGASIPEEENMVLRKLDSDGNITWTRIFSNYSRQEFAQAITCDNANNVFVVGQNDATYGVENRAYLIKYTPSGVHRWTRTIDSTENDYASDVVTDSSGNIFISGRTEGDVFGGTNLGSSDCYIIKYNSSGIRVWSKQFGTINADAAYGLALDYAGNIYFTGVYDGVLESFSGGDAPGTGKHVVGKLDPNGNLLWSKEFGNVSDLNTGLRIDLDPSGNLVVVGTTDGSLFSQHQGHLDAFAAKYDSDGQPIWERQFGTSKWDVCWDVEVDAFGRIFVAGYTGGTLGNSNAGYEDVFVKLLDDSGNDVWTLQFGSTSVDFGHGITSLLENIYVCGQTLGEIAGETSVGYSDQFVAKIHVGRPPFVILGDANNSGEFNNLDIAAFVLALTDAKLYAVLFPDVNPDEQLDMDGNGVFDNLDIADFVAALTGG